MHLRVLEELNESARTMLGTLSEEELGHAAGIIRGAGKVYVSGAGHTGLISRTFTMKLKHVGVDAYTAFDEINPPFADADLLVAVSQSGETKTVVTLSEKARLLGGRVLAITSMSESTLGRSADCVLELPVASVETEFSALTVFGRMSGRNLSGAVFGFALYALFYAIAARVADIRGECAETIDARHTNLE